MAIKTLLAGTFATEKQRQRFELEAEIAGQLRHPAIVTVHEVVALSGGRYALAMELVHGQRIDEFEFAAPTHRERQDRLLSAFIGVSNAVSHAHRSGVIHRDLKPSNILIDADGNPRLLDFGIARRVVPEGEHSHLTHTGDSAWTLAYASPEQLENPRSVDVRSDLYSLGVVLYELLAGMPPYETQDVPLSQAIARVRHQPPAPLQLRASLGGGRAAQDLQAVVMHALEKEPSKRYSSVGAFASDLARLRAGEAVNAPSLGLAYTLRKALRQRWRPLLAALAVLTLMGTGLFAWTDQRARTRAASQRTASEAANAEGVRMLLFQLAGPMQVSMSANSDTVNDPPSPQRQALDMLALKLDMGHLKEKPHVEASLRGLMAEIYFSHDLYTEAEHHVRESIRLLRRAHEASLLSTEVFNASIISRKIDLARTLLRLNRVDRARTLCQSVIDERDSSPLQKAAAHTLLADIALAETTIEAELTNASRQIRLARAHWEEAGSPLAQEAPLLEVESRIAQRAGDIDAARMLANTALYALMRTGQDEDPNSFSIFRQASTFDFKPGDKSAARITMDFLDRGYRLNEDFVFRAYWILARAQIIDPATNDYISFYNIHVTRSRPIAAVQLARDGMFSRATNEAFVTWRRLGEDPEGFRHERMAIALKCTDWCLRDGDMEAANRWSMHALKLMRERSTTLDPDSRLPAITLHAADLAMRVGDLDRARSLLDEAVASEMELAGRAGEVDARARVLRAVLACAFESGELVLPAPETLPATLMNGVEYRFLRVLADANQWRPEADRPGDDDFAAIRASTPLLATSTAHRTLASRLLDRLRQPVGDAPHSPRLRLAQQLEGVLRRASVPITLETNTPTAELPR